jgi:hypothetical protein
VYSWPPLISLPTTSGIFSSGTSLRMQRNQKAKDEGSVLYFAKMVKMKMKDSCRRINQINFVR